jgi:hypothetical protein
MTRRWTYAGLGLVLLATAVAYLPAIDGEFLFDDTLVVNDPLVASPLDRGLGPWLASPRALLTATFALNHATVGIDTRGWHLTNVLIHLVAVVLAWRVALRILRRAGLERPEGTALAAAALFALHPLQTESVAYIAQRAESLASALYLAALFALLARDDAAGAGHRGRLLALAGALELLGLLVKPILATLPLAWLVVVLVLPTGADVATTMSARVRRWLPAALPLLALSAAATVWGIISVAGSLHAGFDIPNLPVGSYFATQFRAIPFYVRLLLLPVGQCADWYFRISPNLLDPPAIVGAATLVAATAGVVWLARRATGVVGDSASAARLAAFGVLFFLVLLAPSSSVVPLRDPVAEHRVYLAGLGLILAATAAATFALRRFAPTRAGGVGVALATVLLALAGGATAARNRVWTNSIALYQDAMLTSSGKARVQAILGEALSKANRQGEALPYLRRALDLSADGTVSVPKVRGNLVTALLAIGRLDEARAEVAVHLAGSSNGDPDALALLANVEFVAARISEAEAAAIAALRRDPTNLLALKYLGLARAKRGDLTGALGPLRKAAALNTTDSHVLFALGEAEASTGDLPAACRAYGRGAELPMNARFAKRARAEFARLGCR